MSPFAWLCLGFTLGVVVTVLIEKWLEDLPL